MLTALQAMSSLVYRINPPPLLSLSLAKKCKSINIAFGHRFQLFLLWYRKLSEYQYFFKKYILQNQFCF